MGKDVYPGSENAVGNPPGGQRPRRWSKLLVMLVLVAAVAAAAGYYFKFGVLKWSEPYQMALDKLKAEPRLTGQIGEPIQDATPFPSGEIGKDPNNASARLYFDVAGPKGRAHVQVDARRIDGKWGLSQLTATPDGGNRVVIDTGAQTGLDEAPRFQP
jgi:hypothetical protein